jgi:hypothetical protein
VSRTLAPRVVVTHRPTEWQQLLAHHAVAGQARFFLESRGRDPEVVVARHEMQQDAVAAVERTIATSWRRARVGRADFPAFLFEPEDIVVAVGQDGLVPNLAKYLSGQVVIGVNPDPERYEGVLVRFPVSAAAEVIAAVEARAATVEERTMVQIRLDDGQRLTALNEIYVGHRTHQSARYLLRNGEASEHQSSSGVIVASGTGATGWARSIATERETPLEMPSPTERALVFFVREAWPSVATGATLTEGVIGAERSLSVVSEMEEGGVAFGDGMETDRLPIAWGQQASVGVAPEALRLAVP